MKPIQFSIPFLAENYSENIQKCQNFGAGPKFPNALYNKEDAVLNQLWSLRDELSLSINQAKEILMGKVLDRELNAWTAGAGGREVV